MLVRHAAAVCVTALILAAGRSARMGAPKALLPLAGRPMLQHVIDAAVAAPVPGIVLVLGNAAQEVAAAVILPSDAVVVVNPHWEDGQATSLRAGLDAIPESVHGALVLLGDQPEVRPDAIWALAEARRREEEGGALILRAAYRGRASHPVVLDREVWPGVEALRGDQGARALLAAHAGRVQLVEVGGDPPEDVDTPEDLARVRARLPA
jgi:molybdenum cofactor cytidylyltransferase